MGPIVLPLKEAEFEFTSAAAELGYKATTAYKQLSDDHIAE